MECLVKLVLHIHCLGNHYCHNGKSHHEYHNLFTFKLINTYWIYIALCFIILLTMQRYGIFCVCANISNNKVLFLLFFWLRSSFCPCIPHATSIQKELKWLKYGQKAQKLLAQRACCMSPFALGYPSIDSQRWNPVLAPLHLPQIWLQQKHKTNEVAGF